MESDNNKKDRVSKSGRNKDKKASPLDVKGVDLGVTTDQIVNMIREGRERYG